MTSFTNEQRQTESVARNCQRYRCQSAWNLDTQYQSWTAHLLLDTPLLHWRRTVSRHGGTNLRSIILNRDTGMPQTWGGHVAMLKTTRRLTNSANGVLVTEHTDCSRVCSLSKVTHSDGTHFSTRNFIYVRNKSPAFQDTTTGQEQHCAQRSHCHRQWKLAVAAWAEQLQACHCYVQHGLHFTLFKKNKICFQNSVPKPNPRRNRQKKAENRARFHLEP